MRRVARFAAGLLIGGGFVLLPGLVQADDCALAPGVTTVFGMDTCAVDPADLAIPADASLVAPVTAEDSLAAPDPSIDEADNPVPDGQWDWLAPTGDDADPN